MIQVARDNGNTINDSKNTPFDKPIFLLTRDSYYYYLLLY